MSELTYKKITDVETVEALNDAATVFINDNGAMKQVAADKFGAVKSIDGITPDETGNIKYGRSNPIPFNKAGNTIKCTMPFAEAIAIASSGTNQANVTLALSTFDANTSLLVSETKYASSVTVGIKAGAGEKLWLQADFDMDDGSVIRLQLNPDESVIETIIKPESEAVKTVNGVKPDENGDVSTIEPYKVVFINMMGSLMCQHTAEEIAVYASNDNFFNRVLFVYRVKNIANPTAPTPEYISTEVQHGPAAGYCRICFGDEVAPIIIDAAANTITLDPDWVAPAPCVKTINGVVPDENGDVVVEVPELAKPDWNQNDETAADYVKGRTHYDEINEVIIVEETTITGANGMFIITNAVTSEGKYLVRYNGAEYECTPKTDPSGDLALGNLSLAKSTLENTGEPFLLTGMSTAGMSSYAFFADKTGTHIFSAVKVEEIIHTIPEKYIPDTIARIKDIPAIEGLATEEYVDTKVTELTTTVDTKLSELAAQELTLPKSAGVVDHGTAGQFAVSDGMGGIMWKTLVEAEEVSY